MLIYIHVEEPSMKALMEELAPKIIPQNFISRIIDHGSKHSLLKELPNRLRGYKQRSNEHIRAIILVDRDNDDCRALKQKLEQICASAHMNTKTSPDIHGGFNVVNRIVIEELEAWYFGDPRALQRLFPRLPASLSSKTTFRHPDEIKGGTWEALFRLLKQHGYYQGLEQLPKIDLARRISKELDINSNTSPSFNMFMTGLRALYDEPS